MYISFQVLSLPNCMKHIVCESAYCSTFPCTDFKLYNAHRDNVELTVHDYGADEMETDYLYFLAACSSVACCRLRNVESFPTFDNMMCTTQHVVVQCHKRCDVVAETRP